MTIFWSIIALFRKKIMLSVKEAQEHILSQFKPLETKLIPLEFSIGHVLGEPVRANADLPGFDNSSVDGFAVRSVDLASATADHPVTLRVIADIPAGVVVDVRLAAGQAARILTGAATPAGADAVVMLEDTDAPLRSPVITPPATVTVKKPILPGENIRKRAADITAGQEILAAKTTLRPQEIGMLAMLGVPDVPVHRQPRVVVISSGDELLSPGARLEPGKIHDSNTYMLAALAQGSGCKVERLGVAADSYEAVHKMVSQAADLQPDMIISSAGVSVGAFDFVKDVVESDGVINFWKVNMRPGKPLAFGSFRKIPFFGLPGNPVSAFVSFLLFVQPAIDLQRGLAPFSKKSARVTLTEPVESDGRESYLRGYIKNENGKLLASLTGHQGSGNLFSLVQANALLIIPSGVKSCPLGSEVDALILENI